MSTHLSFCYIYQGKSVLLQCTPGGKGSEVQKSLCRKPYRTPKVMAYFLWIPKPVGVRLGSVRLG
jgi:hypothetical protein